MWVAEKPLGGRKRERPEGLARELNQQSSLSRGRRGVQEFVLLDNYVCFLFLFAVYYVFVYFAEERPKGSEFSWLLLEFSWVVCSLP